MTYEHEIPKGSYLYFGKSAKLKREIELVASSYLIENLYEEILTPHLSYEAHQSIDGQSDLIRFSGDSNSTLALRADSTLDVVRLITKRLGRTTEHKKWFYIQPVFKYPSTEIYQIGIEDIDNQNLQDRLKDVMTIFDRLDLKPTIQISNIMIPKLVAQMLDIKYDDLISNNLEVLLNTKSEWLKELLYVQSKNDAIKLLSKLPSQIANELSKLIDIANSIESKDIVLAPLYYEKMRYYDSLVFRAFIGNSIIARGGIYKDDGVISCGAALYTDNIIEEII